MKPLPSFYRSYSPDLVSSNKETLAKFVTNLHKNVQSTAARKQSGFYDEISRMFGSNQGAEKKKYQSVQAAVEDMVKRTGLQTYLQNISASQKETKKTAQENLSAQLFPSLKPIVRENILQFLRNKIQESQGNVAIAALQDDLLSVFRNDGLQAADVYDEKTAKYINQLIIAEQIMHPMNEKVDQNIGKNLDSSIDTGDSNDLFSNIMSKM